MSTFVFTPSKDRYQSESPETPAQVDAPNNAPNHASVNHVFKTVAHEVAELLQRTDLNPVNRGNHRTIGIRAIEPESLQMIQLEQLTERELEVLQLLVDGHNNDAIARSLYVSSSTAKSHIHSILRKLHVRDRTQAAIRALRSGLVH